MKKPLVRKLRCAVYTRKSSEEGLDMEFNSLDAQREACESYVASQRAEGWTLVPEYYDDGGFSGGTLERPALQRLIADIETGKVPELWPLLDLMADVPAVVLRGENSDLLSAQTVSEMQAHHRNLSAVTVKDRGHVPFLDEPECVAAIDQWLLEIDRSPS